MNHENTVIDHFKLWTDLEWAVIDTETSGLSPTDSRVVEVAVIRMLHGKVIGTFSSLVNPECPIPASASRIHGIDDATVAHAPRFVDVFGRVCELTKNAVPVAYNESFDRSFLSMELSRFNMDDIPFSAFSSEWPVWLDPLTWTRSHANKMVVPPKSNKLADACARWGVPVFDTHRAAADAIAAGGLLWKLQAEVGEYTISEVLRRQMRLQSAREGYATYRQDPSAPRRNSRT